MFFRLACKNVRRSMKDYLVYFITLMLSVCIFYMFNSVDEQFVMLNLGTDGSSGMFESLSLVLGVVSVFISVVLAFLIIYANNFIMRRRRQEIGLYMVLGFSARRTAGMLVVETLLIGFLSLAAGLGVGYLASQAMSVFTAQLFSVAIRNYHFVFSENAFVKTCIYFGIIFLIVMLFNARNVSKQTLVKLLGSGSRNERVPVKRRWFSIFLLIVGIGLILLSYYLVFAFGISAFLSTFGPALLVNFLGTLCFFYGLSGRALGKTKVPKARQLHGLRVFSERQLLSRVNTNAVSMTFICTMLFLTLVIISSVSSLNTILNRSGAFIAPFDISVTGYSEEDPSSVNVAEHLETDANLDMSLFAERLEYPLYYTDILQGEVAVPDESFEPSAQERFRQTPLHAIAVSDYNRLRMMQGLEPIVLPEETFAMNTASELTEKETRPYVSDPHPLQIGGAELAYWGGPVQQQGLWTTQYSGDDIDLVVPDAVAQTLPVYLNVFVADYAGDPAVADQIISAHSPYIDNNMEAERTGPLYRLAIRSVVRLDSMMTTASLVFVGLYIGMIFLVAGAAILALQMLSSATDDRPRYTLLNKLGASRRMIDGAILSQTAIYFFLPLLVGAVHSVVGITFMWKAMGALGYGDIFFGALVAALLIAAIYGVYFVATYFSCRGIIHAKAVREE